MRRMLAAAAVSLVLGAAFLGQAGSALAHSCFDVRATIVGTPGNDRIHGTSGRDVIVGLGGDDRIWALGDADRVCGNGGDDRLKAGSGVDKLDAGSGKNVLKGGSGDDTLFGGPSVDSFWPGPGNDVVDGRGTPGAEWVHYERAPGPMSVDLETGHATGEGTDILVAIGDIVGSSHADVVKGNGGKNILRLGKGNDRGFGKGGKDFLYGGPGEDHLDGGSGSNLVDGGGGSDACLNPDPAGGALHCEGS
jgi:serralysin